MKQARRLTYLKGRRPLSSAEVLTRRMKAEEGAIQIPENIRREAGLKAGQLVELKVVGASKAKSVLVSKREAAR